MKKSLLLILVAVSLSLLVAGCSSGLQELGGANTASDSAVGLSAAGQSGNSELERAIANFISSHVDERYFFIAERGRVAPEEISAFRAAVEKQLREKLSSAPQKAVADFIFFNQLDMEIKEEIGYNQLKNEYAKGKLTLEAVLQKIRSQYEEALKKRDIKEILRRAFGEPQSDMTNSPEGDKNVRESGTQDIGYVPESDPPGPYYELFKDNRPGDALIHLKASGEEVGHGSLWIVEGDPNWGRNPLEEVAMSAWKDDPQQQKFVHKGVTPEYRQAWATDLILPPKYGMWIGIQQGSTFTRMAQVTADQVAAWAEDQENDPYCTPVLDLTCTKTQESKFYCTLLVWKGWHKISNTNIDSSWWDWWVTSDDIYFDDNTATFWSISQ